MKKKHSQNMRRFTMQLTRYTLIKMTLSQRRSFSDSESHVINVLLLLFFLPEVDIYDPSGDIIVIIEYFCLEGQASSSVAEGKLPRKATRLNLWMAIDRR